MCKVICLTFLFIFITSSRGSTVTDLKNEAKRAKEDRSSLVFVFDTTGSMHNDLKQLIDGAGMILDTALLQSNVITNFVFVPFNDPAVGPATVTKDKQVFISALNVVRVRGGGDCPEKSLSGILMALNASLPGSFIYVLTDATASDHRLIQDVLDAVQRKQSQVVFVLTGHCNDLDRPQYKVYQRIAAASFGQVFNLNKTSVHNVLDFVRSSIRGRTVNLGFAVNPAGYNYTNLIPVDSTLEEVSVSVSGLKPQISVRDPGGKLITGPPKLITTLDLSEAMVIKVLQPEAGNWTISVGSDDTYSVKVAGLSNLTFHHGFSIHKPESISETSLRPLQGAYNYMMITPTVSDSSVQMVFAEMLDMEGKTLFEIPLKLVNGTKNVFLTEPFLPPDDLFFIAINGHDANNQEIRRVGATTVQAKLPEVPYLIVTEDLELRVHQNVTLKCKIESLVPVTAVWSKDGKNVQPRVSSVQSTVLYYTINDMTAESSGTYRCFAENHSGISKAYTEVTLLVDPPQVTLSPSNSTVMIGENITFSCNVFSDTLLWSFELLLNDTRIHAATIEASSDGYYTFIKNVTVIEDSDGLYSCLAENKGGKSNQTIQIKVLTHPSAHILGPHSVSNTNNVLQLVCQTENAKSLHWIAPNGTVVKVDDEVSFNYISVLQIWDLTASDDGTWTCVAFRDNYEDRDSINLEVFLKPVVLIEATKNLTLFFGTDYNITCNIVALPKPDGCTWFKGNQSLLGTSLTTLQNSLFSSVLTLTNVDESTEDNYFCFVENAAGFARDTITVNARKNMSIVRGLQDDFVDLHTSIELKCVIDSYPLPEIKWYHNGTNLQAKDNVRMSIDKSTVTIDKVDFEELGTYVCVAENVYERMVLNGTLIVKNLEAPVLSKEPIRRLTMKGKSTILTCRILQGKPLPNISWQFKRDSSDVFTSIPDDITVSEDQLELLIINVKTHHAGKYLCEANNVLGNDSYKIDLVVQYPPQLIPNANYTRNGPMELKSGEMISFSCNAIGSPQPMIIWTKDNKPITYTKNVYLTDSNELIIEKATEYDSGLFICIAVSPLGSMQRNFSLIVYVPPTIAAPHMDPEFEVLEGELVELPCVARGTPKPQLEWRQNGELVTERRKYIDEDFVLRFVANLTDFGEYTCVAINKYGNATFTFVIYIWVPPYIEAPSQASVRVLSGDNATIQCNAIGFPIPTVAWEFKTEQLTENTTYISFNNFGDIYIRNASSQHDGNYTCIAENNIGVDKRTITLIVYEVPKILKEDFNGPYISTTQDNVLTISCRVTGKPKPFVIWSRNGHFIETDSHYEVDQYGSLTMSALTENMSGFYTCLAKNFVGEANKTVEVQIYPTPNMMQSDETHNTITVVEGTNRSIECPLRPTNNFTVKWYKDATLICQGNLNLRNISRDNAGTYACTASNAVGSAYTTVNIDVDWRPEFLRKVENALEVVRGDDIVFDCAVDAKPVAKTQWLFNSKLLSVEDKDSLKLMNLNLSHSGLYKCVANNPHGRADREYSLDVLEPPFISHFDILDVQLKEGNNATLDCVAKGSPKPNITWTFNNTNWHLINHSLESNNTSRSSEGIFRCDAVNRAGRTHLVYRVQVLSKAVVSDIVVFHGSSGTNVEGNVDVLLGKTVRIACNASGNPTPHVQWIKNGNTVAANSKNITYADLVLTDVARVHSGQYTCMVSNEVGFDEKTLKVEVLEPPKISTSLFEEANLSKTTYQEVMSGQTFYLHCHPFGNPVPQLYWFKDGVTLRLFDDKMVLTDFGEIIVSNNALLEHSGNYTCVARNKVGETAFSYLVDVLEPPPKPKESLLHMRTTHGKKLVLNCPVLGAPAPKVLWIKHPYTEISEKLSSRIKLSNDNVTLTIDKTESTDAGKYSCMMSNKVGTTEVEYLVHIQRAPSMKGSMELNNNVTIKRVNVGRSVALDCITDGEPKPTITWFKNAQPLSKNIGNIQKALDDNVLTIWRLSTSDAAQYVCVAENVVGIAHRRFDLKVTVPGKWSSWSQWSLCNVTCGLGYQHRSRSCQYINDDVTIDSASNKMADFIILDESACKGGRQDRRKCHMPVCEVAEGRARWGSWGSWSQCSGSCGLSTQARTRRCRDRAGHCYGDNMQIRKCPHLPDCNADTDSSNDVLYTEKKITKPNPFIPEMTYELEPHFDSNNPEVEEFYVRSEPKPLNLFDIDVTKLNRSKNEPCELGFTYDNTTQQCEDIDECLIANNECHLTQSCRNTRGGYSCACDAGYAALGPGQRCLDINECAQETAMCEYACVNVAGGYVCACPSDMRLHTDKHTCVHASSFAWKEMEEVEDDYLALSMEFPERYTKQTRN